MPILKVIITFDEDNNTSIEFEKLHPQLKNSEYIRIVLHYYAKMLADIDFSNMLTWESFLLMRSYQP